MSSREPQADVPGAPSAPGDPGEAGRPSMCVQLTVWTHGRWQARADWGDGHRRQFYSPFELARFLANPPAPAGAGTGGGLR